jgi:uncharacterized membrane protein YsdA (DUF1294 family)
MNVETILGGVFGVVNVIAFFIIAYDKRQARRGNSTERISEGLLFFMATAFGSMGVYAGMLVFRHKTQKWYFQIGIPLLVIENLALLYVLREFFLLH